MRVSESTDNIFKALVKYRGQLVQPSKDAKNPFFKSNYVTLEGVQQAIDAALVDTGLSYIQEATGGEKSVAVSTIITHESGEYIAMDPLTVPAIKQDPQAFGSAVTYAKRYSLSAAFGVTSDLDDDANSATHSSQKQATARPQQPQQGNPKKAQVELLRKIDELSQLTGRKTTESIEEWTGWANAKMKLQVTSLSQLDLPQTNTLIGYVEQAIKKHKAGDGSEGNGKAQGDTGQ